MHIMYFYFCSQIVIIFFCDDFCFDASKHSKSENNAIIHDTQQYETQ